MSCSTSPPAQRSARWQNERVRAVPGSPSIRSLLPCDPVATGIERLVVVLDSSALVAVLIGDPASDPIRDRISPLGTVHVPHAIDLEVVHALRRLVAAGELSADRAFDAIAELSTMRLFRHRHVPLLGRMWELRDNLSAYDAAFVALAESLSLPLVTCDSRIGGAPDVRTQIEYYA